jgi:short-subunit dehydrogenase
MDVSKKVAVITGASRGIGRALATELAISGCNLMLADVEADELNEFCAALKSFPVHVSTMHIDLTDFKQRQKFIEWIKHYNTPADILINNAGMGGNFGRFINEDWNTIEKTICLNIFALVHLTHELLPLFRSRPEAKIVNISSGIARMPYPGLAVYGATKGFISSFSESLTCELHDTNVSVLCFHPGFTRTQFIESSNMDIQALPRFMFHSPENVAVRIVNAIRKDKSCDYSDFLTGFSIWLGRLIPDRVKIHLFKDLFWRLPNET